MAKKQEKSVEMQVFEVKQGRVEFCILGATPLIYNAMSKKAKEELLKPRKKSRAERDSTLKHDPLQEYRDSVYRRRDMDEGPTRLILPSTMFKAAIGNAALRVPGATKTEIGQLTWVEGTHVDLYGVPELFMSVVRSAGMNATPDIRTRAIVPEWACRVSIRYVQPQLSGTAVATLLQAAGMLMGVGDFRQQKGAGNFGTFETVDEDDETFQRIIAEGGMEAQDLALREPSPYDQETEEMYEWFGAEIAKLDPGAYNRAA